MLSYSWSLLFLILTSASGASEQAQCQVGELLDADVIPKNGFEVDHLHLIGEHVTNVGIAQKCVRKCCEMGPENCQYVWIIWKKCFAVSCSSTSADACEPILVPPSGDVSSIYMRVTVSDSVVTPSTTTQDIVGDLLMEGAQEEDTDLPPVANAGPDMVIHFPEETSVTLDGTLSTDDKGITYYLWQLTYEDHPDQATLIDPSLPELRVLNLTPGKYTFTLTVTDISMHLSTDTVIVDVLKVSEEDSVTLTPTLRVPTTSNSSETPPTEAPPAETPPTATEAPPAETPPTEAPQTEAPPANMSGVEQGSGDSVMDAREEGMRDLYSKQSNLLKIVLPVLFCVALILVVSAIAVAMTFCFCERNRRSMKHLYQYKRLPGTIEKT